MAIGGRIIEVDTVDSTNKMAAELIVGSGSSHGTVILAHEQTAGRGQRGRQWLSGAGLDLTLSIVLRPQELSAMDQFGLSKLTALAVRDTVRSAFMADPTAAQADIRVKWPNDILVDRRKVAGILIECELAGDRVRHAIVGIGLNVNSTNLPEELGATSLCLHSAGRPHDRRDVLRSLLAALDARYLQWSADRAAPDADYAAALWARGRWSPMWLDGAEVSLRPMDVDGQGRLLVEAMDGQVASYGLDRLRFAGR